jgi:hypothetical protein
MRERTDLWAPLGFKYFKIIQTRSNMVQGKTGLPELVKFEIKYGCE